MWKHIFLVLLVAVILVGVVNNSTRAEYDPVEIIKNIKTPVYLHSLTGGDSLVHELPTMVGTWWQSLYPPTTFGANWYVQDERLDAVPGLTPSDRLELRYYDTLGVGHDSVWVNVDDMAISFVMEGIPPYDTGTYYLHSTESYNIVGDDFVSLFALQACNYVASNTQEIYHVKSVSGDTVVLEKVKDDASEEDSLVLYVTDRAIGIPVLPISDPTVPTLTQWGIMVLVALFITSAIYIMRKRRKAMVPA